MRRRRATFVGLFVACGFFAVLSAAQAATVHRAVVGAHYATIVPACAPPAPGRMTCYALRRLPASASTPGAMRYVVPAAYPVGPAGGYTPSDFWSAYDLGSEATLTASGGPGTGQTVGIVDAGDDPNIEADLGTFDTEYGLPACTTGNTCFKKVGQTGSTTSLPSPDTGGSDVETSLDVETVHAVCPDCHILLVEANSLTLPDLGASVNEAVSLGATEVSNSYGGPEAGSQSYESDYSHTGVPITVSAGDQGYYNWVYRVEGTPEAAEANAPASYPGSVAVGGTSLALNADGSRASETVWNDQYSVMNESAGGAGGGGCSTLFTAPTWQASEAGYKTAGCSGDRLVADVSADADPLTGFDVYDSYTGPGWQTVGGTSLSAPIIAAVYGLVGGGHSVTDPAQTLYTNSASASGSLYDVTSGGNGYCDGDYSSCTPPANDDCGQGSTACNAATGYDGPSGVGAPNGLAGFMAGTSYDPTHTSVSCSPGSGAEGVATTCMATVTDTATSGASTPTGVVAFKASLAGSFGSYAGCALAATATTGVASCQLSFTPSSGGSYTVTGHYFGDTEHAGSSGTSSTLTSNASVDPTSTSVNCSPVSVDEGGQATTCTATVIDTATTGATIPTGTVNFTASIGGSFGPSGASCTTEVAGGKASCQVNFAPTAAGAYTVSDDYLGDGTHGGSQGTSFTLGSSTPIDQTSTSVNCLPASGTEGVATMCTVTVRDTAASGASTPTGPVDFSSSMSGSFAGDADCVLTGTGTVGEASCEESFTPSAPGPYTVNVTYYGDGTHAVSGTSSSTLQANPPVDPTSTSVYCSPASGGVGVPTTCTATVTDTAASGGSPPTGMVHFSTSMSGSFGSGASCTLAASTSGTGLASVCEDTFTPSSAGSYTVTASYLGDSMYAASAGTSSTLQATGSATTPDDTSTSLMCSPASGGIGVATSCTTIVTDTSSKSSTPSGHVAFAGGTFGDGGVCTLTGTGTTGTAACQDTFTPSQAGSSVLTAYYEGDAAHATSSGQTSFTATSPSHGTPSVGRVSTSGTTASVPVKCTGTVSCSVKLTLTVTQTSRHGSRITAEVAPKSSRKTLVLASKSITVPAGKTLAVKLSLNGTGKKLLKKQSLKVQLKVVVSGKTVKTLTLTFKKAKTKRL